MKEALVSGQGTYLDIPLKKKTLKNLQTVMLNKNLWNETTSIWNLYFTTLIKTSKVLLGFKQMSNVFLNLNLNWNNSDITHIFYYDF